MLWHLGALLTLERKPLPGYLFPREQTLIWGHSLQVKANQSRAYTPDHLLYGALTLSATTPLIIPGSETRQLQASPRPQNLLRLFKLVHFKPGYSMSPCLPHWNHPCFPPLHVPFERFFLVRPCMACHASCVGNWALTYSFMTVISKTSTSYCTWLKQIWGTFWNTNLGDLGFQTYQLGTSAVSSWKNTVQMRKKKCHFKDFSV